MKALNRITLLAVVGLASFVAQGETAFWAKDACVVCAASNSVWRASGLAALTNALAKVTGVQPVVYDEGAEPANALAAIYLGDTRAARAAGLDATTLRLGDWRLVTRPGRAYLLARSESAVCFAATDFVERYCGYDFLSYDGKDDPYTVNPALAIPVGDVTVKPAIYDRSIYHGAGSKDRSPGRENIEITDFARRRAIYRQHGDIEPRYLLSRQMPGCHSSYAYVPVKEYAKTHPEYYSMTPNGQRRAVDNAGSQLCYSNPDVLEVVYQKLLSFVEADCAKYGERAPRIYDFTQQDNASYMCNCPKCKEVIAKYNRVPGGHAEGGDAGLQLEFANKLVRRINEKYPDVQVRIFAYVMTECPPKMGTIAPDPNLVIWYCDVYSYSEHIAPLETPNHFNAKQVAKISDWLKLTSNMQMWDYTLVGWQTTDGKAFPCTLDIAVDAAASDAKFYVSRKLPSIFMEMEFYDQAFYWLNFYVMSRLYIDPTLDADMLMRRWCRIYGNAADEMYRAIRYLASAQQANPAASAPDWHGRRLGWRSVDIIGSFMRLVERAYAKAPVGSRARARIAHVLGTAAREMMGLRRKTAASPKLIEEAHAQWLAYEREYAKNGFDDSEATARRLKRLDTAEELLNIRFTDLPQELKGVKESELLMIDWHAGRSVMVDEASERGKAVALDATDEKKYHDGAFQCGVYDNVTRKGTGFTLKPEQKICDGRYHWYKYVPPVYIGRGAIFWFPQSWRSSFSLADQHILADGAEVDPNNYELWFSAKFGERTSIDRLVFRRKK